MPLFGHCRWLPGCTSIFRLPALIAPVCAPAVNHIDLPPAQFLGRLPGAQPLRNHLRLVRISEASTQSALVPQRVTIPFLSDRTDLHAVHTSRIRRDFQFPETAHPIQRMPPSRQPRRPVRRNQSVHNGVANELATSGISWRAFHVGTIRFACRVHALPAKPVLSAVDVTAPMPSWSANPVTVIWVAEKS